MSNLNTKQTAKAIRTELRSRYGWTAKQVSVRLSRFSMGSSVSVSIKTADIPLPLVKAIAEGFNQIDRCSITGEILSGGNLYVTTDYEHGALDALAETFQGQIVPGFRFGSLEVVDKRSGGWMSIIDTADGTRYHDAYPDSSAAHSFAHAVAASGTASGYADQVAAAKEGR